MQSLSERIQTMRKQAGLSQQQMAESLGISRGALSQIETGRNGKKFEMLPKMAKLLGCRIDDFFPEMDDQQDAPGVIWDEDEDWWDAEDADAPRPMTEESGPKGAPVDDDWPENFMW